MPGTSIAEAVSSTDMAYCQYKSSICLRVCYEMSGTGIGYAVLTERMALPQASSPPLSCCQEQRARGREQRREEGGGV
eukprot:3380709-Rhodomonas_salina.1